MCSAERRPSRARCAIEVLHRNDRGAWTRPSPRLYPHQWSWDAAFVAMGWAHLHPMRAVAELFSLLDEVARELVDERSFGAADYEPLLLARLVLLQLFSPEVYRIGARREGRQFLDDLKELKGVGLDLEIQRLRR